MAMNKRGQGMDVMLISFIGVIITLIIIAPIGLKLVHGTLDPLRDAVEPFGNTTYVCHDNSTACSDMNGTVTDSSATITHLTDVFDNFWDFLIVFAFVVTLIILILTAFWIDAHPIFFVFFLVTAFIAILFVPTLLDITEGVWDSSAIGYSNSTYLPLTGEIKSNFVFVILGIMVIIGVIMYGKIRASAQGGA